MPGAVYIPLVSFPPNGHTRTTAKEDGDADSVGKKRFAARPVLHVQRERERDFASPHVAPSVTRDRDRPGAR